MEKDESTSPKVGLDSVIITNMIEVKEKRYVAIVDVPGAYLSADLDDKE